MNTKKIRKYALIISITGLVMLMAGVGFQLYGVNNGKSYSTTGTFLNSIGLIFSAIGMIIIGLKKTTKSDAPVAVQTTDEEK